MLALCLRLARIRSRPGVVYGRVMTRSQRLFLDGLIAAVLAVGAVGYWLQPDVPRREPRQTEAQLPPLEPVPQVTLEAVGRPEATRTIGEWCVNAFRHHFATTTVSDGVILGASAG